MLKLRGINKERDGSFMSWRLISEAPRLLQDIESTGLEYNKEGRSASQSTVPLRQPSPRQGLAMWVFIKTWCEAHGLRNLSKDALWLRWKKKGSEVGRNHPPLMDHGAIWG